MHPLLTVLHFGAREVPIYSYGLLLCVGLAVAIGGVLRAAASARLDVGACIAAIGFAIGGGFGGAWLLHGLVQSVRLGSLGEGFARPGIAFFGGALGAGAAFLGACRGAGVPGLLIADRAVPALAIGHAFGRLGCLLGGCCFGRPWDSPLALHYVDTLAPAAALSVGRHPVPLYEALGLLVIAVTYGIRPAPDPGSGRRLIAYAASYSALRFGLEFLRGDDARGVFLGGYVSTSQLVAALVLASCAVYTRRSMRRLAASAVVLVCLGAAMRAGAERWVPLALTPRSVVLIGAGWFRMGSDDADVQFAVDLCKEQAEDKVLCRPELFADEQPQHRVFVSALQIDRTEVSQDDYRRCVQAGVCPPQRVADVDARLSQPEQPAAGVTWEEAARYCAWLGGRLPSEAEWERAARGNSTRRFPWGQDWNSRVSNHGDGSGGPDAHDGYDFAAPVSALPDGRSAYGLLNMAGNAWELTADRYDREAYAKGTSAVDPRRDASPNASGEERVLRGGSWRSPAYTSRVTQRAAIKPNESRPDVGFRCAYNVR